MTGLQIIFSPEAVDRYLIEHGLENGAVEFDAILLQQDGTASGAAAVMLTFKMPDGRIVLGKTTMRLLAAAMGAFNATLNGGKSV